MGENRNSPRYAPDLLKGKVALVTGGGTGMGRSTALEMSRCGARIALFGRRLDVVEKPAIWRSNLD